MQTISTKLASLEKLTDDVWQFDFSTDEDVEFEAGQFFLIQVPANGEEKACTRAYSIASPPSKKGEFSLCVKLLPDGRASGYMRSLKIGDEVGFQYPFGHFVLNDVDKDVVLVATGTGLAPFMSMIPTLFEQGFERKITLYFCVRYEADLFYLDELHKFEAEHENFKAVISLSRPEDNWKGECGRVTAHCQNMEVDPENTMVYICGNGQMVKDVKVLFEEKGLPKGTIRFEQFTVA